MTLPAELRARVLQAAQSHPSPPRADVRRRTAILSLGGAVVAVGLFLWAGGMRVGQRPAPFLVGVLLGWLVLAVAATWMAFARGASMLGRPRKWLVALTVGAPFAIMAWSIVWSLLYPETAPPGPFSFAKTCFELTLAMGAGPLVAFALARRQSDPVHPRATGAALGVAAGAWAGIMVDLWCPHARPSHVLTGHVLPIAILSLLGLWIGHRIIAVRPRS